MPWRLIALALQAPAPMIATRYSLPPGDPAACVGTPSRTDEIIVCARPKPADRYRYREIQGDYAETQPRAETGLFGAARGSIDVVQKQLAPGVISNRAMITIKVPF